MTRAQRQGHLSKAQLVDALKRCVDPGSHAAVGKLRVYELVGHLVARGAITDFAAVASLPTTHSTVKSYLWTGSSSYNGGAIK